MDGGYEWFSVKRAETRGRLAHSSESERDQFNRRPSRAENAVAAHCARNESRAFGLLGLTFQKGPNRIGAGRLFEVATLLRVPVGFFFENIDASPHGRFAKDKEPPPVVEFMASNEGLQLSLAFMRIKDAKVRKRVLNLVRQLAEGDLW